MYTLHDGVANGLLEWGQVEQEAMWRMPLHMPYRAYLDSQIADMVNACSTRYAGSITAALFLKAFVPDEIPWVHFDLMAANTKARPGRPEGGEAMILRAVFSFLRAKFSK
jgi:leucyl aminopeptidase